jgi:hypothetical protein
MTSEVKAHTNKHGKKGGDDDDDNDLGGEEGEDDEGDFGSDEGGQGGQRLGHAARAILKENNDAYDLKKSIRASKKET